MSRGQNYRGRARQSQNKGRTRRGPAQMEKKECSKRWVSLKEQETNGYRCGQKGAGS